MKTTLTLTVTGPYEGGPTARTVLDLEVLDRSNLEIGTVLTLQVNRLRQQARERRVGAKERRWSGSVGRRCNSGLRTLCSSCLRPLPERRTLVESPGYIGRRAWPLCGRRATDR